jgi:hypothetical protein
MELDPNLFAAGKPVVLVLTGPMGALVNRKTGKPVGAAWKTVIDMSAIADAMDAEAAAVPEAMLDDDRVRGGTAHEGVPAQAPVEIARLSQVVARMGYMSAGSVAAYTVRMVAGRCQIGHQLLKTGRYVGGYGDRLSSNDFDSRQTQMDRVRKVTGMMAEMFGVNWPRR